MIRALGKWRRGRGVLLDIQGHPLGYILSLMSDSRRKKRKTRRKEGSKKERKDKMGEGRDRGRKGGRDGGRDRRREGGKKKA